MLNYGYKSIIVDTFGSQDVLSSCLEKRSCFSLLDKYIQSGPSESRMCVLYGLRRSGKTELMKQCIDSLGVKKTKAMLLTCLEGSDFDDVLRILDDGCEKGFDYFFIDEVTYAKGFQNVGEILSNSYVNIRHKKVVITGTDSLGLSLPASSKQYDRCLFIHTTYFPYVEYCRITDCSSIDEYIRRGCALSADLPKNRFENYDLTNEYIQTSIVDNIIHSLEKYEDTDHYPKTLTETYSEEELKNAILRAVNLYSGEITLKALNKEYKSSMIGSGMNVLANDRINPITYQGLFDSAKAEENIRSILGVMKNDEMTSPINAQGRAEILSFLNTIDVFKKIPALRVVDDVVSIGEDSLEIMTHPGIFHSTIKYTLQELEKMDNWFTNSSKEQRDMLIIRSSQSILGHVMENIIVNDVFQLLCNGNNPSLSCLDDSDKRWYVSKLNASINGKKYESDIIIIDRPNKSVYLFEVKHSSDAVDKQSSHLEAPDFLKCIEDNFGIIKGRAVLYNGVTDTSFEVPRINASDFLKTLYGIFDERENSVIKTINKLCFDGDHQANIHNNLSYSLIDYRLILEPDGQTEEGYPKYSLFLTDFTEAEKESVWNVYMSVFPELAQVEDILDNYLIIVTVEEKNKLEMYFDVTVRDKGSNTLISDRIYHDLTKDEIKYLNSYLPECHRQNLRLD